MVVLDQDRIVEAKKVIAAAARRASHIFARIPGIRSASRVGAVHGSGQKLSKGSPGAIAQPMHLSKISDELAVVVWRSCIIVACLLCIPQSKQRS
ncbi:hypothetical protein HCN50_00800 [Bradyrhizobium sp. WSM 1744]|uniref:Uncharacterized protein n=1 Tax=Bradyrhizobium archetypum TaxID=2721160 RepID=A0A7Y4GZM9_9BRAD|nr:hypothetical protein [Bradyrhizobium archetypum]NOJ44801.1 hypothetical protein [Bradyrhizobium archetypum]